MGIVRELNRWGTIFLGGWGRFFSGLFVATVGTLTLFVPDSFPWRIAGSFLLVGVLIVGCAPVPERDASDQGLKRVPQRALRWTRIWGVIGLSVVNAYLFGSVLDVREYPLPTEPGIASRSEPQFFLPGWYRLQVRPDQNLSPVTGQHLERFYREKVRSVGEMVGVGGDTRELLLGFDSRRSPRLYRMQVAYPRWLTVEWSPDSQAAEGMRPSLVVSRDRDKGTHLGIGILLSLLLLASVLGGTATLMVFVFSNGFETCALD